MRLPADSSGLVAGDARQLVSKIDGCQKQNSAYQFARVPVMRLNGCSGYETAVYFLLTPSIRMNEGKCLLLLEVSFYKSAANAI
jgi:hypothetical protein